MLISKEYNFPDYCPKSCPYRYDFIENGMKSYCYTCPILLCQTAKLIKPEDFPEINACAWWNFFRNNMMGTPEYYIKILKEKYGEVFYESMEK